jgi:hypothetical protein
MRTARVAIFCMADANEDPQSEVKASGDALYKRYTNPRPNSTAMPNDKVSGRINPDNMLLVNVEMVGFPSYDAPYDKSDYAFEVVKQGRRYNDSSAGDLGVYVVVHAADGSTMGLRPSAIGGFLAQFGLTDVRKLAFVACALAKKTDFEVGTEEKHRTFLYDVCEHLGKQNIKPKMAGWTDFITVIYPGMQEQVKDRVGKPVIEKKAEINYADNIGRKAIKGHEKDTLAMPTQERRLNKKLFYVYREGGVAALSYPEWTDKPT